MSKESAMVLDLLAEALEMRRTLPAEEPVNPTRDEVLVDVIKSIKFTRTALFGAPSTGDSNVSK